jgi:hypothetical protein
VISRLPFPGELPPVSFEGLHRPVTPRLAIAPTMLGLKFQHTG